MFYQQPHQGGFLNRFFSFMFSKQAVSRLILVNTAVYILVLLNGLNDFLFNIKEIFPGVLMGKVLLLSVIPNLLLVYLFYTLDSFKLAVGMITGAMIYLIPSFFML